jgi:hypothetical protein
LKIKPLSRRELIQVFKDYRDSFADWSVEHDTVLVRSQGLIKQCIAFEALRDGAYRPSCSVRVLTKPSAQLLFRFLDVRHREVLPRDHSSKWPRIVKAMEEQFVPRIRHPLDVVEVIRLAEEEVMAGSAGNIQYCAGLATLNAYIGNSERALLWCSRIEAQLKTLGREPADWELAQTGFSRQLRDAIGQEREQAFLKERAGD